MGDATRDSNRVPSLIAKSDADNSAVVVEADAATKRLKVSAVITSGGSAGTQYADGDVAVTHPIGTIPVFNNAGIITAVSAANPLPITGTISVGSTTDSSAFTAGASTTGPIAGVFNDSATDLTSGQQGTTRSTAKRALHTNLRNNSGTEVGTSTTPLQVSLANTAANATAVKVDGSAVTQPVSNASLPLPTGAATSANQATEITSLATIAALSKVEDAPHTTGDTGMPMWAVRNDTGAVFAGSDGDYIPFATDSTGALRVDLNGTVSTNNSTTAVLAGNAAFTGTSEDVLNYNEIRISVIASHVSATDGLSIQQSEDNTNWDFTDTYTIPAATGKTYSVPRQARYFRIVYTNGATLQTSFRLQTILNRLGARVSSQRANDAYTNETDLEQQQSFLMGFNGTTWDRLRTTGTGVLTTSTVLTAGAAAIGSLTAGSAIIGKVGIDQTTPGTTNAVALAQIGATTVLTGNGTAGAGAQRVTIASDNTAFPVNSTLSAETTKVIGTVNVAASQTIAVTNTGTFATQPTIQTGTNSIGKISDITTSVVPGTAATNLGKAEDAAHTTGDVGVFSLGVRNDTLADVTNATADYSQVSTDIKGRVMTAGAPRALKAMTQVQVSNTTTETSVLAATASTFHDVYGLILANTGASTTKVSIRDATAGTVRMIVEVPTLETRGFMLPVDSAVPQSAVNTAWTVQCGTATTALEVTLFYVSMV